MFIYNWKSTQKHLIAPVRRALDYYTKLGATMEEELKKDHVKKKSMQENMENVRKELKQENHTNGTKESRIESGET